MLQTVEKSTRYIKPLNKALNVFFKDALKISLKDPSQAFFFFQTVKNQRKASHTRAKYQKMGIHVPPMMIMSITNRCNLHCQGCYHQALRDVTQIEMSQEKLRATIAEASDWESLSSYWPEENRWCAATSWISRAIFRILSS